MIEIGAGPSLVVRVAPYGAAAADAGAARIAVAIADPALASALTTAVADAVAGAIAAATASEAEGIPVVSLRSRKRMARVAGRLVGAIAIVAVTARNARHLVALVDGIRAAGAAGVQLVWDGVTPPRDQVERHVFAALERARTTPGEPPVVLAATDVPASALHLLIAHRAGLRKEPR